MSEQLASSVIDVVQNAAIEIPNPNNGLPYSETNLGPKLNYGEINDFILMKERDNSKYPNQRFRLTAKNYFMLFGSIVSKDNVKAMLKTYGRIGEEIVSHNHGHTLVFVNFVELKPCEILNINCFMVDNTYCSIYVFTKKGTKFTKEWVEKADPSWCAAHKKELLTVYQMIQNCKSETEVLQKLTKMSDVSGALQAYNVVKSGMTIREDEYIKNYKPWGWQQLLFKQIDHEANERDILWFWNKKPKFGKSTIAYYLMTRFPEWFTIIPNLPYGRDAATIVDSALDSGWNGHCCIINLSMSYEKLDWFYSVLEQIKEPFKCSVKYKGKTRITGLTTVVVFANFAPQPYKYCIREKKWEALVDVERLKIFEIEDPKLSGIEDPNPPRVCKKLNLFSGLYDSRPEDLRIIERMEEGEKHGGHFIPTHIPDIKEEEKKPYKSRLKIVDKTTTDVVNAVSNAIAGVQNDPVQHEECKKVSKFGKKKFDPNQPRWFSFLNNATIDEEDQKLNTVDFSKNRQRVLLRSGFQIGEFGMVICSQIKTEDRQGTMIECRKYAHWSTFIKFYKDYYSKLKDEERTMYECMTYGRDQKLYFDIDAPHSKLSKDDAYKLIKQIKLGIMKVEPCISQKDIMVFNSHGPTKSSFHIVVDNWKVTNHEENEAFSRLVYSHVDANLKPDGVIDFNVYKCNQQFRLYMSQKWGSNRIKILDTFCNKWEQPEEEESLAHQQCMIFMASLITNTSYCKPLEKHIVPESKKVKFVGTPIEEVQFQQMSAMVEAKYPGAFKISGADSCGSKILFKRLKPTYCDVCMREHENQGISVSLKGNSVHLFCFQVDKSKVVKTTIIGTI